MIKFCCPFDIFQEKMNSEEKRAYRSLIKEVEDRPDKNELE